MKSNRLAGKEGQRSTNVQLLIPPFELSHWVMAAITLAATPAVHSWQEATFLDAAAKRGAAAQQRASALSGLIRRASTLKPEDAIEAVNTFFNRGLEFATDLEVWGVEEHWASPLEFLEKGKGDCEDYAIGKYMTLIAAGVDPARLKLVYAMLMIGGPPAVSQAHMVLAYYPEFGNDPLILDNALGSIRPASRRKDLVPVFSFGAHDKNPTLNGVKNRWALLLEKAKAEGFL